MQNTAFLHSDDFYHNLLSSFLESAKVNPNSFFELRIQNGSLRHKFTTTERPDPVGNRNYSSQNRMAYYRNTAPPAAQPLNQRASFYNIPASQQPPQQHIQHNPAVNNYAQRGTPASKRRYTAILSPSPTTTYTGTGSVETASPTKTTENINEDTLPASNLPRESTPEKPREPDHIQETHSEPDDDHFIENIVTSPFSSPNRFACLSEKADTIVETSLTDKSLSSAQNAEEMVRVEPDSTPPIPSLDLTLTEEKECRDCKMSLYRHEPVMFNAIDMALVRYSCTSCNSYSTENIFKRAESQWINCTSKD